MIAQLDVKVTHQALYPITDRVKQFVPPEGEGLCTLFIQHTSASLASVTYIQL